MLVSVRTDGFYFVLQYADVMCRPWSCSSRPALIPIWRARFVEIRSRVLLVCPRVWRESDDVGLWIVTSMDGLRYMKRANKAFRQSWSCFSRPPVIPLRLARCAGGSSPVVVFYRTRGLTSVAVWTLWLFASMDQPLFMLRQSTVTCRLLSFL
jgi:hypothetical protein